MMDYNLRDGRTYMYFKAKPLYAFGHGLSYTSFRYANLRISSSRLREDGEATVSVEVTNTGSRAGDEVVQMYVQHVGSKVDRPREELKDSRGFRSSRARRNPFSCAPGKGPGLLECFCRQVGGGARSSARDGRRRFG